MLFAAVGIGSTDGRETGAVAHGGRESEIWRFGAMVGLERRQEARSSASLATASRVIALPVQPERYMSLSVGRPLWLTLSRCFW